MKTFHVSYCYQHPMDCSNVIEGREITIDDIDPLSQKLLDQDKMPKVIFDRIAKKTLEQEGNIDKDLHDIYIINVIILH